MQTGALFIQYSGHLLVTHSRTGIKIRQLCLVTVQLIPPLSVAECLCKLCVPCWNVVSAHPQQPFLLPMFCVVEYPCSMVLSLVTSYSSS